MKALDSGNHTNTRNITLLMVLRYISDQLSVSRSSIADHFGVSKTTVNGLVSSLIERGLCIERVDESYTYVGRKPFLISLNAAFSYHIGLSFTETGTFVALADFAGDTIANRRLDPLYYHAFDSFVELLEENISDLILESGLSKTDIALLAIAAPGVYDEVDDSFFADGFYADWDIERMRRVLGSYYQCPIYIVNDLNAAAWGEYCLREKKQKNLIYISGGLGFGSSLIINDAIYKGNHGQAGEISLQLWPVPNESREYTNISRLTTLHALLQRIRTELPADTLSRLGLKESEREALSAADVLNLAKTGDPVVLACILEWAETIAVVITNLVILLDCDNVVIGGEFVQFQTYLLSSANRLLKEHVKRVPELSCSEFGEHASVYGLMELAHPRMLQIGVGVLEQ